MPKVSILFDDSREPEWATSDSALVIPLQRALDGVEKLVGPAEPLIAALRQVGAGQMADRLEDEFGPDHTVTVTFSADPPN